jgi:hypothetical protein
MARKSRAYRYDAAVAHAGRSAADLKRDALDRPAEILRLAGIGPGMHVAAKQGHGSADAGQDRPLRHRVSQDFALAEITR